MSETPVNEDSETPETPEAATEAGEGADDQKRKFRAALERKAGGKGGSSDAAGQSKVHGSTGPAKAQRTFRRKSGG